MELDQDLRARQEVRQLVARAKDAQEKLAQLDQAALDRICEAISKAGAANAARLGKMACAETGFGRPEDKETKNRFAAIAVWEAMKNMPVVGLLREDREKKIWELGVPVGVIAAIVPSTNPTSSVLYKAMISLKAGNAVVFSPHPNAMDCTLETTRLAAQAAEAAGCPAGALSCLSIPSMDAVQELMRHPDVRLILATGGGAMVRAAYSSGKPAIGVGAGNGPAYLHRSCKLPDAVAKILESKTFDNGTICASEQSIVVERDMEQAAVAELEKQGAYFLSKDEADRLAGLILRPNGTMNPAIVGKPAVVLAKLAGLNNVPDTARVLIARESRVGAKFPYSHEKLCPILAFYVEADETAALNRICEVLHFEGRGHTFAIHAEDEAVIRRFAEKVPASRILVNTPAALGGVGSTTNLFPAMTLGCGAVGGSSSSNNIGPLDLVNLRRVAWGVRDSGAYSGHTNSACPVSDAAIAALAEQILKKLV